MIPKIGIILATYNGEDYIKQQLSSITQQVGVDWHLYASDDGSTDHTCRILQDFHDMYAGKVTLLKGPQNGLGQNFISTLKTIKDIPDYIAFCDQDDVWLPEKLLCAVQSDMPVNKPALYCSAQTVCDAQLNITQPSNHKTRKCHFGNALVQNIVSGNTAVLNQMAAKLLRDTQSSKIIYHDWWSYILVTAVGGKVIYDPVSNILYRQHAKNVIGARQGIGGLGRRVYRLRSGQQAQTICSQTDTLNKVSNLTKIAQHQLNTWRHIHNLRAWQKPNTLKNAGIHWQTNFEQRMFDTALRMGYFDPPKVHVTLPATYKAA